MDESEVYARVRSKAQRTMTFRLRRQERCLTAAMREHVPSMPELARLAAVRSELRLRNGGPGRG